jgi:hypothetical protein
VFSHEECEQTRSSMWDIIEKGSPGFDRHNRDTWSKYSSAGKYGLSMVSVYFDEYECYVNNKQLVDHKQCTTDIVQIARALFPSHYPE